MEINDESLALMMEELTDFRMKNPDLASLLSWARETVSAHVDDMSSMDIIESWEELTGRNAEELEG